MNHCQECRKVVSSEDVGLNVRLARAEKELIWCLTCAPADNPAFRSALQYGLQNFVRSARPGKLPHEEGL